MYSAPYQGLDVTQIITGNCFTVLADVGAFRNPFPSPGLVQEAGVPRRRLSTSSSGKASGDTQGRVGAAVYWNNYAQV